MVGGFCFVKGATIFDLRIVACRVALTKTQREITDRTSKISKQKHRLIPKIVKKLKLGIKLDSSPKIIEKRTLFGDELQKKQTKS